MKTICLNKHQKLVCIVAMVLVSFTGLYPPFHIQLPNGFIYNLGHGWLWAPPVLSQIAALPNAASYSSIDTSLLITQWLGIVIVAAITLLLLKDRAQS